MGHISQKTAYDIWCAHRELAAAQKLKAELKEAEKWGNDEAATPRDVFGRKRGYELGVPSGPGSHRLYNVPASLFPYCLEAHIAQQERELAEACIKARMEFDGVAGDVARAAE